MTFDPNAAVVACLVLLALIALLDGVVVHLVRERLHRRPGSRVEHLLHTGRALVFPLILFCFFGRAGFTLGIAALIVDQVLEIADMTIERRSRAYSGGLRTSEYLLHGAALTLRSAAIACSFAAGTPSPAVVSLVEVLLPGAILGAILHVVLIIPFRRRVPA
jgi:hypothetical protein